MRKTILFLLFLVPALTATAGYPIGAQVEDFVLLTPDGEALAFSEFSGDVILLNFFTTW